MQSSRSPVSGLVVSGSVISDSVTSGSVTSGSVTSGWVSSGWVDAGVVFEPGRDKRFKVYKWKLHSILNRELLVLSK